jgi:hypothetical protein
MSGYQDFSFGENDSGIGEKTKRFKAEGGHTYRVSFGWWKKTDENGLAIMDGAPQFTGAQVNYIPNAGYIVNSGPEFTKLAGEPARTRIGTVLVVWPTLKDGTIDKTRLAAGDVEVIPWIFSGDKYKRLNHIHKEFPFGQHDVTLSCTDTQFQKIDFSPCKDSLLAKMMGNDKAKGLVDSIFADVARIVEGIRGEVGREMTIEQVREKLAGGGGGGGGSAPVAQAAAVASEDIDSMVDDMLD